MKRLSAHLGGPEIWVKRDDCTGLAGGGNKTRKLEFLVADALRCGANTLVTVGGVQSNHTRQTAAAAAAASLKCELVLRRWVPSDDPHYEVVGNILLSRLLGAKVNVIGGSGRVGTSEPEFTRILECVRRDGGKPYPIPAGGSDHPLGGLGYAVCAKEIVDQASALGIRFDAIVHATSSGSTQAGLIAGLRALDVSLPVIGVAVGDEPGALRELVGRLARETLDVLGCARELPADAVQILTGFAGPGYGLPTERTIEAIRLVAALEGLLVDPVYEGKAIDALIDLVWCGRFASSDRILYLHLGGIPALHAYADSFRL